VKPSDILAGHCYVGRDGSVRGVCVITWPAGKVCYRPTKVEAAGVSEGPDVWCSLRAFARWALMPLADLLWRLCEVYRAAEQYRRAWKHEVPGHVEFRERLWTALEADRAASGDAGLPPLFKIAPKRPEAGKGAKP